MSKRYYLCDIIGDGSEENPFRPAVANYNVSWTGPIETGEDGRPIHANTIVLVNTENHTQLRNDPKIDPMAEYPLDGKISGLSVAAKNMCYASMVKHGFSTQQLNSTTLGYREVLQEMGRQRSPVFDIDNFDVR